MRAQCKDCGRVHDVGASLGGKLGGAAAGAALGALVHGATKSKVAGLLVGGIGTLAGAALGHVVIDQELLPACPSCRGVLVAIDMIT
jgi:hypothetical protein